MHKKRLILAAFLLATSPLSPASPVWAQGKGHEGHMAAAAEAPSNRPFMDAHEKMMKDMGKPLTGDADVDFVQGMIPHHQGAIDMAKVELEYGKNPVLRKLAETIIAAQEKEIADMQAWLKEHKK
jgi:uncharacterized protein (DUF305 family)